MWKLSRTCTAPLSSLPFFFVGQGVQVSNGNDKGYVEVVAYVYYPHSLHFPTFLVGQGVQVSNGNDKCYVEVVTYVYYPPSIHFPSFLVGQGLK